MSETRLTQKEERRLIEIAKILNQYGIKVSKRGELIVFKYPAPEMYQSSDPLAATKYFEYDMHNIILGGLVDVDGIVYYVRQTILERNAALLDSSLKEQPLVTLEELDKDDPYIEVEIESLDTRGEDLDFDYDLDLDVGEDVSYL